MHLVILLFLSIIFIIVSTTKFKLHPFLALLFTAIGFGLLSGMSLDKIIDSIKTGFGNTIGSVGILIIAGIIIGTFLENSGGVFTMARKILKYIGEKHVHLAMSIIGYLVSIPVFCDSGFVILTPLNRALSKQAKISILGSSVALGLGLTATHCLVPPTPGPIAAAEILGADLGLVILLALPVSLFTLLVGWLFSIKVASKLYIDPNPELSQEQILLKIEQAPSALKAFMPIFVPILLIIIKSALDFSSVQIKPPVLKDIISFIGDPNIALIIGVIIAFTLPKKFDTKMLSTTGWVGKALVNAAIIIMITGAGGAFGMVLRNSNIAEVISDFLSDTNLGILLPFIIAAAIKTAQGSSTVALITAATIIAPMTSSLGFDSAIAKALVVLSIGTGSMVASHVNDSYFWIFTQMIKVDVKNGYKYWSFGTFVIGCSTAILIWIISLFIL
ncbi:MAG: GntP family permease [Planctomycetota bacterium]